MSSFYDVALSFAGEQRTYVRAVAEALVATHNLSVFFDEFLESEIWGKDLGDYLDEIYRKRSRFVVICISKEYRDKKWTNHERKSALAAAIESESEKVLPLKFDETELPGLRSTTAHLSAHRKHPAEIAQLLAQKLSGTREIRPDLILGIRLWRIMNISYIAEAFSGEGASRLGGRWHSRGTRVVYCTSSLCSALVEVRSLRPARIDKKDPRREFLAIEAKLPTTTSLKYLYENELPNNWAASRPRKATKVIGDAWIRENTSAILSVPSTNIPLERMYLLNPQHSDFKKLVIVSETKISLADFLSG
jgi:RES domain-containing protein